ncbi:MAG: EamA family transporter, partial [Acidimicrobiales bacterium]
MGALFGLLAALSISTTEFFGRRVTNEVGPIVAASVTSLLAAVTALAIAVVTDGSAIGRDLLLGGASGLGFGVGMSTYLQGVRVSSSAVVGPVSAALTALIPFTYAATVTEAPSALGYVGAGLAITGLMFVTIGGSAATNVAGGLPFGIMSG